jgi:lipopolysaccharide export LptBFGC system permease protein LptF
MGLRELAARYRAATGPEKYDYLLDLYKKFTIPMAAAAFVLVGVPLGIRRRAEGRFSGVVYSLLIFVSYYVVTALTENIGGQFSISPLLVSITPNLLVAGVGLYLLKDLNTEEQTRPSGQWKTALESLIAKVK